MKVKIDCRSVGFNRVGPECRFRGNATANALSEESPHPQARDSCRRGDSFWFLTGFFFFTLQQLPDFCLRAVQQERSSRESLVEVLLMQQQSLLDLSRSAQ